jgi:WD40 repeat protein
MNALPNLSAPDFYVVGGTMWPDAQSYVRRSSDEELYTGLMENDFCHVLTARQMGKSSLMVRTAARLRKSGIRVAALDLTGIGTNLTPEQWYSGLIVQLGDRLRLEDELLDFWSANLSIGPMQRWMSAIRKVALPSRAGRLVIFIDEIDAVASLNFSTDEFFSGIRECYNLRNEDAEMNRLTFCLLGVVNPSELISDTRTTPFNVGRWIELNDFTEQEALPLAEGLGRSAAENHTLLRRILYWTNGHPYLTQRLCKVVSENGADNTIHDIDESIERTFFSKRAQEHDDNLVFVRERLLRSDADITALLNLYSRVRRNKTVAADDSQPLPGILRLSGITRSENGKLRVRNRIYDRVFNNDWVKANLPGAEVRRQRAAFWRGVIRTTAVAAVILTIVTALAITAFRQRNLALNQIAVNRVNKQLLYMQSMKAASQEYEAANIARVETLIEATTPQSAEEDLRGFEWFLFWRYANTEIVRIKDPGQIANAKFHQGDETIAIASAIHTAVQGNRHYLIKLYDRKSQKESLSFTVPSGINFDVATFSPDDKYVATDAPDNSVTLWDLSLKQQVLKLPGPGRAVVWLTFSSDQQALAAAFIDGTFRVWDLNSGKQKFEGHSRLEQPSIAFSPDQKYLAVGVDQNVTELFDAQTGRSLRSFSFPKGPLGLIFFSPDGSKLFATTTVGHLYCRNVHDGQLLSFSESHSNEVISFAFAPNGKTLATGSLDRALKIWDVSTVRLLRTIRGHGGWVTSVHWSPDGRYLLSGDTDGLIKIWDMQAVELPVWPDEKPAAVTATGFTPQNELLAIGRGADRNLKLWNLSNGKMPVDLGPAETVSSAAFSKEATLVAVAVPPEVRIYSVTTGTLISTLAAPARAVYSLQFSPDGSKLLSGNAEGDIIVSEVSTGQMVRRLNSGNSFYRAVFSPDGQKIASADQDGKIRIWNVVSWSIEKTLIGHEGAVRLLCFSPNGQILASAGGDNTVRLWDPTTGQELKQPIRSDYVQRLAFAPDGKRLITASYDGTVILWDPGAMQEVVTLRRGGQNGGPPSSVSFSGDGLIVAVSDQDGAVKVWQGGEPRRQ